MDLVKVESDSFEISGENLEDMDTPGQELEERESVVSKMKTYNQENFNKDIGQFFVPPTKLVCKHGLEQWKDKHIEI